MAEQKLNVKGTDIILISKENEDYISLTDIVFSPVPFSHSFYFKELFPLEQPKRIFRK